MLADVGFELLQLFLVDRAVGAFLFLGEERPENLFERGELLDGVLGEREREGELTRGGLESGEDVSVEVGDLLVKGDVEAHAVSAIHFNPLALLLL